MYHAMTNQQIMLAIHLPDLAGTVRAAGIGMWRLPASAFTVTPAGNLLVQQGLMQRYANHPSSKLWVVVATKAGTTRLVVLNLLGPVMHTLEGRLEAGTDMELVADDPVDSQFDPSCFVALLDACAA